MALANLLARAAGAVVVASTVQDPRSLVPQQIRNVAVCQQLPNVSSGDEDRIDLCGSRWQRCDIR